jgi:hypothetical protein
MNIEAISQILDAVAFILVTPEFLNEKTLNNVKNGLGKLFARIARVLFFDWFASLGLGSLLSGPQNLLSQRRAATHPRHQSQILLIGLLGSEVTNLLSQRRAAPPPRHQSQILVGLSIVQFYSE